MSDFKINKFFDLTGFEYKDIFNDINSVWEVLPKIKDYITMQFKSNILVANYKDKKNVFIGEGTVIHEGVLIEGPAIIGKYNLIRHGSFIRESCIIGNNVTVHHGAEIKQSIFLNDSYAPHVGYVGNSIVGNKVNIAAGAILANYRLDKKSIVIHDSNNETDTGLEKFGSVIGDFSNIGVNCVLNPGTILGKNTTVYPLIFVKGVHKDNEIIK